MNSAILKNKDLLTVYEKHNLLLIIISCIINVTCPMI